jgi:hypothetical protein
VLLRPPGISSHHLPQLLVYPRDHLQALVVTTVPKAVTMVLKGTLLLQASHQMEHHLALRRHQVSESLECLLVLLLRQGCLRACPLTLIKDDEVGMIWIGGTHLRLKKKAAVFSEAFYGHLVAW